MYTVVYICMYVCILYPTDVIRALSESQSCRPKYTTVLAATAGVNKEMNEGAIEG